MSCDFCMAFALSFYWLCRCTLCLSLSPSLTCSSLNCSCSLCTHLLLKWCLFSRRRWIILQFCNVTVLYNEYKCIKFSAILSTVETCLLTRGTHHSRDPLLSVSTERHTDRERADDLAQGNIKSIRVSASAFSPLSLSLSSLFPLCLFLSLPLSVSSFVSAVKDAPLLALIALSHSFSSSLFFCSSLSAALTVILQDKSFTTYSHDSNKWVWLLTLWPLAPCVHSYPFWLRARRDKHREQLNRQEEEKERERRIKKFKAGERERGEIYEKFMWFHVFEREKSGRI